MKDFINYDVLIFDYEGTLSEAPNKRLTLKELLYEFDFRNLSSNNKIYNLIKNLKDKKIYVVGIIETNREIEQKMAWMKINFPMIKEQNCVFISNQYKKSQVISEIINKNNYDRNKILFVDDKMSHIQDVSQLGIDCILVKNI